MAALDPSTPSQTVYQSSLPTKNVKQPEKIDFIGRNLIGLSVAVCVAMVTLSIWQKRYFNASAINNSLLDIIIAALAILTIAGLSLLCACYKPARI